MCQQCQSHNRDEVGEAFQGVLATSDIAQKCGDNPFLIHRQPTKTDRKNGDNLRQRQSIFTFDKAIMDSLCFFRKRSLCHGGCGTGCDSNVVTRQRDSFMTTRQQTITGHYKVNKPFNCCHAVGLLFPAIMLSCKGRLGASLLFQFSCAKCESSSPSTVLHRCLSRAIFWGRQIFFHVFNGKT